MVKVCWKSDVIRGGEKFDYEKKKWGVNEVDLDPKYLGATRLKYVLSALECVSSGKVLEIGCGGGAFSRAIKRHRPELMVIGSDLSGSVLEVARKMGGDVHYRRADVYELPFADYSFDAVVSFDVWEHLERPVDAFKEAHRVLKPGGLLHFFAPIEGNRFSLYQLAPEKLLEIKRKYTGHIQSYTQKTLVALLLDFGFEVRQVNQSLYLLYQLADLSYFIFLGMRGRNVAVSVEGYLQFSEGKIVDELLGFATHAFGWLSYLENELFGWLPGGGIHITAVKRK